MGVLNMGARSSPARRARKFPCESEVKSSPLTRGLALPRRLARFHMNTPFVTLLFRIDQWCSVDNQLLFMSEGLSNLFLNIISSAL